MFEFDDTISHEDFDIAWKIKTSGSRLAWRLRRGDTDLIVKKLSSIAPAASVRTIAGILACSKPTVMKFIELGLVQRLRRRRRGSSRRPVAINVWSVISFVRLCGKHITEPPMSLHAFSRLRRRIGEIGPNGSFDMLPRTLTVSQTAKFIRCSKTSVLRLIKEGYIDGHRRTPCRWEIRKSDIPYWCREKK